MASQPVSASGNLTPAIASAGANVANRVNVREQRNRADADRAQKAQQFERSAAQQDRQLTESERANQATESFRTTQAEEGKRQFDTQFSEDQRQFNVSDQNEKTKIANDQQHRQFQQTQSKRINDFDIEVRQLQIAMTQATGEERQRLAKELLEKRRLQSEAEKNLAITNSFYDKTQTQIKMMYDKTSSAMAKLTNAETSADETATGVMEATDVQINNAINNPLERDGGAALMDIIGVAIGEPLLGDEPSTFLGLTLDGNLGDALFNQGPFEDLDEKIANADPNSTGVQVAASKAVVLPMVRGLTQALGLQGKESEITSAIEGAFRTAAGMGAPGQDPRFEQNAKENLNAYFDQLEKLGVSRMQMSSMFEQIQIKMNEQSGNIIDSIGEGTAIFGMDIGDAGARELSRFWGGAMQGLGDNAGLLVGELRGSFPSAKTMAPLMDAYQEVLGTSRRTGDMNELEQFFRGQQFRDLEGGIGDIDQQALLASLLEEQQYQDDLGPLIEAAGDAKFATETAKADPGDMAGTNNATIQAMIANLAKPR